MSGSSGGGISTWDTFDSCERLVIESQLSSPKEDVVSQIQEGDKLGVSVIQYDGKSIVVLTVNGATAGGVASPSLQRLRECIEQGTTYQATVTSKNSGQIRVRIQVEK